MKEKVLLLQPPFFRFCGSHNDRIAPSLSYLSSILDTNKIEHIVFNADATNSNRYWSMSYLFNNFSYFKDAVDDKSPLYDEVIEYIIGTGATSVLILGADPLIPTTDMGSPFIAANFSKRLKKFGIYTIGLGPYYNLDTEKFLNDFDCILRGEPSSTIVKVLKERAKGIVESAPLSLNITPNYNNIVPLKGKDDLVFTSFGCLYPCEFCIAGKQYRQFGRPVRSVDPNLVAEDISKRESDKIYIGDLNFSDSKIENLEALSEVFKEKNIKKELVVEMRTDKITETSVKLLKELGVKTVKIGVESFSRNILKDARKDRHDDLLEKAVELLRKQEISYIFYLLLGGQNLDSFNLEEIQKNINRFKPLSTITSIWSYDLNYDYKYDTHFSPVALNRWGIPEEIFHQLIRSQNETNLTVGKVIGDY